MSYQHKELADGRWSQLSLLEQMANIGSEVGRASRWKQKGNLDYSRKAFERALELVDLTLDNLNSFARLKELARLREALVDYFCGMNQFKSSEDSWEKYFSSFACAVHKNH